MGKLSQSCVCALFALASCAPVFAQRGMASGAMHVAAPVRIAPGMRGSIPAARVTPAQRTVVNRRGNTSFNSVPGLGFDFAHVAALNRARRDGRHHGRFFDSMTPFSPFGFSTFVGLPVVGFPQPVFMPPDAGDEGDVPPAESPAPPQAQRAPVPQYQVAQAMQPAIEPPPPSPNEDTGEYVLVKRDGNLIFAVAFSADSKQLTYVTREGVRRALLLSELDASATRDLNAQRGTTIQIPL